VVAVVGPTGSGKSALALALAERLGGEIVGLDSVQLYRGFDIGSAKPTAAERARVPHHLFDVLDWSDEGSAQEYAVRARAVLAEIASRGRVAILVGGTGLYLRALVQDRFDDLPQDQGLRAKLRERPLPELYTELVSLDPKRAAEIHPNDRFRVVRALELAMLLGRPIAEARRASARPTPEDGEGRLEPFVVYLEPLRAELHRRIEERTRAMLAQGLVEEVQALLASGVPDTAKAMRSIGYAEVTAMLRGELPVAELPARIAASTRQYAKRQSTWFRKVPADLRLVAADAASIDAVVCALRRA
jgi:tRNA dimethylallyltransferase